MLDTFPFGMSSFECLCPKQTKAQTAETQTLISSVQLIQSELCPRHGIHDWTQLIHWEWGIRWTLQNSLLQCFVVETRVSVDTRKQFQPRREKSFDSLFCGCSWCVAQLWVAHKVVFTNLHTLGHTKIHGCGHDLSMRMGTVMTHTLTLDSQGNLGKLTLLRTHRKGEVFSGEQGRPCPRAKQSAFAFGALRWETSAANARKWTEDG